MEISPTLGALLQNWRGAAGLVGMRLAGMAASFGGMWLAARTLGAEKLGHSAAGWATVVVVGLAIQAGQDTALVRRHAALSAGAGLVLAHGVFAARRGGRVFYLGLRGDESLEVLVGFHGCAETMSAWLRVRELRPRQFRVWVSCFWFKLATKRTKYTETDDGKCR